MSRHDIPHAQWCETFRPLIRRDPLSGRTWTREHFGPISEMTRKECNCWRTRAYSKRLLRGEA